MTPGTVCRKERSIFSRYYCEDGSKLTLIDTSCLLGKDNLWRLAFKGQPFVIKESEGGYLFKCPQICRLKIDGKPIVLSDLLSSCDKSAVVFTSIELESLHCNFQSSQQPGKIEIKGTELFITFDHKEEIEII